MTQPSSPSAQAPLIALVRHGETDWNLAQRIQGRTEVELNSTGRAQAAATASALQETGGWNEVIASPLGRAIETAQILASGIGLPAPAIDEQLWERDFGPAEGLLITEVNERWPGLDIPGAESRSAVASRSAGALTRILAASPGAIVVAHGAMLREGLSLLTGTAMPRILNGEVWLLWASSDGFTTERMQSELSVRA